MLAQRLGGGEDQLAGDRVALLRHRRGRAAPRDERLGGLGEFGRRHQHHVIGHLAEAAAQQCQELHRLGDAVARDMPGDRRLAERQFARQLGAGSQAFLARTERGEGARGAAELHLQHPWAQLGEPHGVAVAGRQPHCRLVAEGDRQCVLQVGAAGHRHVAPAPCQRREMAAQCGQVGLDQLQPGADLQHRGGVHDVLGRGAPMHPAPGLAGALGELAHQRQDRVPDRLGLAFEAGEIEGAGLFGDRRGRPGNRLSRIRRHDPGPRLGPRQRRLDLGTAGQKTELAEHRAHRGGAEHVAEQGR